MCGRYVLKRKDLEGMMSRLGVKDSRGFASRYNIAPSTIVPAIRPRCEGGREAAALQWGLVPWWSKDATGGARLANARADGVATKPAFRDAFRQRRCVVPASGFYEWQTIGKRKQPWYFTLPDESPFVFAGLWERWRGADDVELETCSLITTGANAVMAPLHDRMPVILRGDGIDTWLNPAIAEPAQLQPLLAPLPDDLLKATSVTDRVNSVRNEGPECIAPAPPLPPPGDNPQLSLGL